MSMLINPYRHTLLSQRALEYWVAKNNTSFYSSSLDALIGQKGVGNWQRGATSGSGSGDPTFGNDGTYEYLSFDGVDDFLTAGDLNALDVGTGDFTAVVVAYVDSAATGTHYFLSKKNTSDTAAGWYLFRSSDGTSVGTRVNATAFNHGSATMANGIRKNLALVRDAGNVRIVVDGTGSTASAASGTVSNSETFYGGVRGDGFGDLHGRIYGAAFFTTALTDAQTNTAGNELLTLAAI